MNPVLPLMSSAPEVPTVEQERDRIAALMQTETWKHINQLESALEYMPPEYRLKSELTHTFTPHLYGRKITMPKGALLTTRIHLTEHQFVILRGVVSVWDDEHGVVTLHAGHHGITKAGTRRVLFVHEECEWMTFHVTDETDPDKIVMQITYTGGKFRDIGGAKA
jgi:hypothetical protein